MKVLFTTLPAPTHFYPLVPLAWALRTAGHEVRVASGPDLVPTITGCGLTAVPVGVTDDEWLAADPLAADPAMRTHIDTLYFEGMMWVATYDFTGGGEAWWPAEDLLGLENVYSPALLGSINNDPLLDDLVAFARSWEPDLVVWEAFTHAGAIAAAVTGAAHARLLYTADGNARIRQEFLRQQASLPEEHREDPTAEWLGWTLSRFGRKFEEDLLTGHWTIDHNPPSTRLDLGLPTVGMRFVPHNGAGVLPDWLREPPERPRVCVSLGLSDSFEDPGAVLSVIFAATADLDAEVVVTGDTAGLGSIPPLPPNVRLAGFVPLDDLLPTCALIVHHGGPGTTSTAQLHGVPQVVFAQTSLTAITAARLDELGAGLAVEDLTAPALGAAITRALTDPSFTEKAERLRREILGEPTPNELVPVLEKLTTEHRNTAGPTE